MWAWRGPILGPTPARNGRFPTGFSKLLGARRAEPRGSRPPGRYTGPEIRGGPSSFSLHLIVGPRSRTDSGFVYGRGLASIPRWPGAMHKICDLPPGGMPLPQSVSCVAGGPGLEPMWRSGPGKPDYAVSGRKHVVYTVSGPKSVVRGALRVFSETFEPKPY